MAAQVGQQARDRLLDGFAAAAQLAQADIAVRRLDFDDGAHEAAPVRAIAVQKRRLEGNRDGRRAERGDGGLGHEGGRFGSSPQFNNRAAAGPPNWYYHLTAWP